MILADLFHTNDERYYVICSAQANGIYVRCERGYYKALRWQRYMKITDTIIISYAAIIFRNLCVNSENYYSGFILHE